MQYLYQSGSNKIQTDSKFCMISVDIEHDQLNYQDSFNNELREWKDKTADRNWEAVINKSMIMIIDQAIDVIQIDIQKVCILI